MWIDAFPRKSRPISASSISRLSLRRAGKLHHLGIGRHHAGRPALLLVDHNTVTDTHTGEILSQHTIDPNRNYWRNQEKDPGRWPGSLTMNDHATHL